MEPAFSRSARAVSLNEETSGDAAGAGELVVAVAAASRGVAVVAGAAVVGAVVPVEVHPGTPKEAAIIPITGKICFILRTMCPG